MAGQVRDKNVRFRVGYEFTLNGKKHIGEETEASWYLIDQQGKFYSYSPMSPVTQCTDENNLEVRLLINGEYLTIEDIEKRIT